MTETGNGTDTSLSFLEPLSSCEEAPLLQQTASAVPAGPADCFLSVPSFIADFFRRVDRIDSLYEYTDGPILTVRRLSCHSVISRLFVTRFASFSFPSPLSADLVVVLGRRLFQAQDRRRQGREFKAAVESGSYYEPADEYKALRTRYLEYQLDERANIIYVESPDELHRLIKNILRFDQNKSSVKYTPKVRTYDSRESLFTETLSQIPGITRQTAQSIVVRFSTFRGLTEALINQRDDVVNLILTDDQGSSPRILGERLYEKLFRAFASTEGAAKI